jgi:hypothetical protein
MGKELVIVLADAIREYYDDNELLELCGLFDTELEWDHAKNKPSHLRLANRLVFQTEHANNRLLLDALVPSLSSRNSEMIAKTSWQTREYHQEMSGRVAQLQSLLDGSEIPSEISVSDGHPFTAKSELRDFLSEAGTEVFIVDAYIGVGTLDCLREVKGAIRILTGNQKQSIQPGFEAALQDFRNEGRPIEVRQHQKLHDRYVIFNERCWLVGSSIKDAGKKALNVIECIDNKEAVAKEAERKWKEGTTYP